jgi:HSP20 family protein
MSRPEDSLSDLKAMQERMNALLEESLSRDPDAREEFAPPDWAPVADAFETEREVLLFVDAPGVRREDLRLEVDGAQLVVRGERRLPEGLGGELLRRVERPYGAFARAFELPATVDESRITAEHRDGVLQIRLPKRETASGRRFQIQVE